MLGPGRNSSLRDRTRRRFLVVAALLGVCAALMAVDYSGTSASTGALAPEGEFTEFRHNEGQHARLPCLLCHRRAEGVTRPMWPGHVPCSGCHAQQFSNESHPICSICHTDTGTGAMKAFPRLRSFGARFDHARHTQGAGKPRAGCVACHRSDRSGRGFSIPSQVGAHAVCFTCHAPNAQSAGRDISSCGTCHLLGATSRFASSAGKYAVNFSHAVHGRARVACAECHTVRSGAGQGQQVLRPAALQHRSIGRSPSCGRCHDGKRAFGGDDFTVCSRCHQGNRWRF